MLESLAPNTEMEYKRLSLEEQTKRGILGRLAGVIADFKHPTRNGRIYTEELWDKTFDSPLMKEKLENRCLFGELGHPADRQEIDMEKIAICMAEAPKKGKDGKLYGVFDILATPNGKILKTLCDYGCAIGVSSRGSGDTYEDWNGQETVDIETFDCECWDAVLIPAVKEARPKYVTESLNTKKSLKEALEDVVKEASEDDQKVMKETIDNLDFEDKDDSSETKVESDVNNEQEVAANDGMDLVKSLQEALQETARLQKEVVRLNEQVSVSYTKELTLKEDSEKLKGVIKQLTEKLKRAAKLTSQVTNLKTQLQEQIEIAQSKDIIIKDYRQHLKDATVSKGSLKESLSSKDSQIKLLTKHNNELNENLLAVKKNSKKQLDSLTEELRQLKTDSAVKQSEYARKLENANKLIEKYHTLSNNSLNRYIESKALTLGVNVNEIKNKLNENYTFDEIDSVCESLRSYKMNMSNLPFNIGNGVQRVTLKEDTTTQKFINPDDVVDDSLLEMLK